MTEYTRVTYPTRQLWDEHGAEITPDDPRYAEIARRQDAALERAMQPTATHMYCPLCGWMHDEPGIGKPECPRCQAAAHWVSGTDSELAQFRAAIATDPSAWRSFPTTDYWLKGACA